MDHRQRRRFEEKALDLLPATPSLQIGWLRSVDQGDETILAFRWIDGETRILIYYDLKTRYSYVSIHGYGQRGAIGDRARQFAIDLQALAHKIEENRDESQA